MDAATLVVRLDGRNPNHHLWNNNGTWFVHYTVYPTPITKGRVRRSLNTKCVRQARQRRDQLFHRLTQPHGDHGQRMEIQQAA